VRLSIKGPVPSALYEDFRQSLDQATIEVAADKNALKKFFREQATDEETTRERDRLFEKKKSSTYRFEPDFD
jgi:hypothetical protein